MVDSTNKTTSSLDGGELEGPPRWASPEALRSDLSRSSRG